MDNDTTSLRKSLSSLAEANRKVLSGPLSKDRKLDNNCFSPATDMENTGSTDILTGKGWKTMSTYTKFLFLF